MQETCSSIANTLGLCLSCTNPSIHKLSNKLCLREVRRSATHLYLLLMGSFSHSNNAPCTQQKFHVNYLGVPCWTVTSELPLSAGGRKWSLYPQGAGRTSLPIVPTITYRLLASTLTTHQAGKTIRTKWTFWQCLMERLIFANLDVEHPSSFSLCSWKAPGATQDAGVEHNHGVQV